LPNVTTYISINWAVGSMSAEDVKADIADKLEKLYSIINKIRFYNELAMFSEAEKLLAEAERLRDEMKLSMEEAEKLADELDEYYITGNTPYGEEDPLTYWASLIFERLFGKQP